MSERSQWEEVSGMHDEAVALVDMLRELPGEVEALLEMAQDPVDAISESGRAAVEEKLEPVQEHMDQANEVGAVIEDKIELGSDLYA